jgi:hypothetical protein
VMGRGESRLSNQPLRSPDEKGNYNRKCLPNHRKNKSKIRKIQEHKTTDMRNNSQALRSL